MSDAPLFLGLMSGTSCDGIDAAIVRMGNKPQLVCFRESLLPEKLREPILRLACPGVDEIDTLGELDRALGDAFADAALKAIDTAGLATTSITAIGSHGQTIRHRPDAQHPFTLQIGSAASIAEKTGITTVSDFRNRDIAVGGQGAPLVPFAHRQLFARPEQTIAVLNIGGIANITWLGSNGETIGFDTGPGNMVMDDLMLMLSDGRQACDTDGDIAASGNVCKPLLEQLQQHPYFKQRPPKSTGREDFGRDISDRILAWPDISDADRLATASALTASTIRDAIRFLPARPEQWLICGGGAYNKHLLGQLQQQLAPACVKTTDDAGIPACAVEAVCFAMLARQTLAGQSNTLPAVTGATHPVCGGQITPGNNWPALLEQLPTWIR